MKRNSSSFFIKPIIHIEIEEITQFYRIKGGGGSGRPPHL